MKLIFLVEFQHKNFRATFQGGAVILSSRKSKMHGEEIWYKATLVGKYGEEVTDDQWSGDESADMPATNNAPRIKKTWFRDMFGVPEQLSKTAVKYEMVKPGSMGANLGYVFINMYFSNGHTYCDPFQCF